MRIVFLLLMVLTGRAAAETVDGVAAIVNDKIITFSDVREYIQPVIAQLRRSHQGPELMDKVKEAHNDALNHLIERQLILADFKTKGYSFPDTVIDEQMNDTIAKEFGGDRAAFIKTLQAENITLAKYREQMHDRIVVQAMRNKRTQSEVVVSPFKIEAYYKTHLAEFKDEEQIKLRMILIKKIKDAPVDPATNTTTTVAAPDPRRQLAEEILAKLDGGDSFESLAKLYSEGKDSQKGGEWGWIKRGEIRKELSDPAFALTAGQHSRLIDTADGYYLLQVDNTKKEQTRPLAQVRDLIEKELLQEQRAKMQDAWVKQLRAKAYVRKF